MAKKKRQAWRPAQNTKTSGIDLKTANGRQQVLRCLIALCNYAKDLDE